MKQQIKNFKSVSCLFSLLFIISVGMAQQKANNTNVIFSNGNIVSTENASSQADHRMTNKTYDEYMVGVIFTRKKQL